MKRKELIKRIGVTTLAIASVFSLAACSSGANEAATMAADGGMYESPSYEFNTMVDYNEKYYDEAVEYEDGGDYGYATMGVDYNADGGLNETQANASVAKNRKLIKTVDLSIETTAFDLTIAELQKKVNECGGYIENEYTYNGSMYNDNAKSKYANITVRVADTYLDTFVSGVSGIGNVTSKSTSTNDVTLNYVDTESKKEMYLAEQESLLALLEKAETIEDITYLTERLTQIRYNIESMESTLRVYDDLVDYATVNININEVAVLTTPTVVEEKTPMEELKEGFAASVQDVIIDLRDGAINFVIRLPYIIRTLVCLAIPVVIIFIIVMIVIKASKKKAKKGQEFAENIKKDNKILEEAAKAEAKEKAEEKTDASK